jgi:hypothetical protein
MAQTTELADAPDLGAGISSCVTLNAAASNTRLFSYEHRVLLGFGGMRGSFAPGFSSRPQILKSKIGSLNSGDA